MLAILMFLFFCLCGAAMIRFLLPEKSPVVRVYLGVSLGLMMMMWLPAACAFFLRFSAAAQGVASLLMALLTAVAYGVRSKKAPAPFTMDDKRLVRLLLLIALPLTILGGYLQWTHNIMPAADGSLHVGQSTYGDLALHLSIASGLRNASFPPDYTILPGELLSYPFLADTLSTSLMLLGFDLRAAIVFPGIVMTALTFSGYVIFAARLADSKKAAALAALFFFINGGLGFIYLVDMQGVVKGGSGSNELQSVAGLWERMGVVLEGWYQTPANHAEFTTYNLRWSNVIADMMIPQRTTLAGWCQVIPCMYLLCDVLRPGGMPAAAVQTDGSAAGFIRKQMDLRSMILLGLWGGMLPMVNTHCFLALGLMSLGWLLWDAFHRRGQNMKWLLPWAVYGAIAVAVAAPQLFTWTFRQSVGNEQFLKFRFNWVNGDLGMPDGYFWFYLKNIGLPFLLILLALLEKNEKRRFLAAGAFMIFIPAELIQFQPNIYDNNKLFYIWYMICCVIAADFALELLGRLKGLRSRHVIAVLAAVCCFFTGALAVARECVGDYELFSREDREAAAYIEEHTAGDALFLTGDQHNNPVSSLAGRRIVCGPDLWLYWHGFGHVTPQRRWDVERFYENPAENADVLETYGVDYILVSEHELFNYQVDLETIGQMYPLAYENGGVRIFAVSPRQEASPEAQDGGEG